MSRLTGTVLDPQARAIAGARIALTCGPARHQTTSDASGHFDVSGDRDSAACRLSIAARGFKTYDEAVRIDRAPITVTLSLAPVRDAVTVVGSLDGGALDPFASFDSETFSRAQLAQISNNAGDLVRYAVMAAGASPGPEDIYVDGVPAHALPPAQLIASITVDADPFDVSSADGGSTRVDISTAAPDRRIHMNVSGSSLGSGGGNVLAPRLRSTSSGAAPSVSGPIPGLPITVSAQGRVGETSSQQPIQAAVPGASSSDSSFSAVARSAINAATVAAHLSTRPARAGLLWTASNERESNAGVGGPTTTAAARQTSADTREILGFVQGSGSGRMWRAGTVLDSADMRLTANSDALAIVVPGQFQIGGSAIAGSRVLSTKWTSNGVLQSAPGQRFWAVGAAVSHGSTSEDENPNAFGKVEFGSPAEYSAWLHGVPGGVWSTATGEGDGRHASASVAPFAERALWRSRRTLLKAGVRADYQTGGGTMLSPRLSIVRVLRSFVVRAGAGLFVHPFDDAILADVAARGGSGMQEFLSIGGGTGPRVPVVAATSSSFARPRDVITKVSLEKRVDHTSFGAEYTWTASSSLAGSRRLLSAAGFIDILESNRRLRRHDLHARIRYTGRIGAFSANYTWVRSRDDTDGPFSFPEFQSDLAAERAPSTGVPSHTATFVGTVTLPHAIALTTFGSWHSASPFTILSGVDTGTGLFNDRGGRPRNSGAGPRFASVSVDASRRFFIPLATSHRERARRLPITLGLQGDNVLANRNYTAVGVVAGTPLFERPLAAMPGPSLRVWLSIAP